MPRGPRLLLDNYAYHVLNRGNRRQTIFKKAQDYQVFLNLLAIAGARFRLPVVAACLMPNHWHLVFWLQRARSLSAYMHWLLNVHVHRYHRHYGLTGHGHLYQDRYKAFPIQDERHLYTVLRYVEANPLRAGLVRRAEDWQWSSLALREEATWRETVGDTRVTVPENWRETVNSTLAPPTLKSLRESARRQKPFGDPEWIDRITQKS